jgi:hypothetical protein
MPHSFGEHLKSRVGGAVRTTSLLTLVAFSLLVMVSFLCAAVFIVILQNFGAVLACLCLAGIFCLIALLTGAWYVQLKRKRRAAPPLSGLAIAMSDPTIAAAGVQIIRTLGVKRLLPLLAIGGIALGLMMQRKPEEHQDSR